jgi:phosphoribosylanthranilate isomerase
VSILEDDMTRIKFCGMVRPEDISYVNTVLPDYIGFVFAPGRKRTVTKEDAARLRQPLDKRISAVGVFVDEQQPVVLDLLEHGIIDVCQLHGNESEEYVRSIREASGRPVMRAFLIRSTQDLKRAYDSCADMILLDGGKGEGRTFDWKLLSGFDRPFFLAGGLDAYNVAEAIDRLHPYGVDISSGIEKDGKKDLSLMRTFAASVHTTNCAVAGH